MLIVFIYKIDSKNGTDFAIMRNKSKNKMRVSKFINVYVVRTKTTCEEFFEFMIQFGSNLIMDEYRGIIYMPYSTLSNIIKTGLLTNECWQDEVSGLSVLGNKLHRLYNGIYYNPSDIIGLQFKKSRNL